MQMYACKIRLHGDLYNEVRRGEVLEGSKIPHDPVSAAEIKVLQYLHGGADSVVDIVPVMKSDLSDAEERDRLRQRYSPTISGSFTDERIDIVTRLFGPDTVPLPQQVEGVDHPDVVTTTRQKRTRVVENADASAELLG